MRTLILNSADIVEGTNNTTLEYQFAGGNINLVKGQKVALASIQMYNSTFNITTANQNNSFSYIWVDGTTNVVAVPDGYYDIPELNNYLHFVMVQNKHYLVSSTGDFVYFITLGINPSRYAVEVNCFGLNTTIATANTWVLPAGAVWAIPTLLQITPSLVVPSTNFRNIIGFVAGNYPNAPITGVAPASVQTPAYTTTQVFLSTTTPQVSVVSSYIFTCSLVNNNYAVPNNLLYSFAPQGTIGEQFTITPNQYVFIDVMAAQYNTFRVSFIDQNLRPVIFQDPNMIIQLVISDIGDDLGL